MNEQPAATVESDGDDSSFLPADRMNQLREEWADVQTGFVDDPRDAVARAHAMVEQIVNELTDTFTRERTDLEGQWKDQREPDTETLRVALQRYRSFFNRLLAST
jgi:hypothetical protein